MTDAIVAGLREALREAFSGAPVSATLQATREAMRAEARVTKFDPDYLDDWETREGLDSLHRDFCDFYGLPQVSAEYLLAEAQPLREAGQVVWVDRWLQAFCVHYDSLPGSGLRNDDNEFGSWDYSAVSQGA